MKYVQGYKHHDDVKIVDCQEGEAIGEDKKSDAREQQRMQQALVGEARAGLPNAGGKHFPVNPDSMYGISKAP